MAETEENQSGCTHDCSSCGADCASRSGGAPESLLEPQNKLSDIRHVIGVVSGKGGVGKSLVTSLLAVEMQRRGYRTAILDADVTGPSIPKAFGLHQRAEGSEDGIYPVQTKTGIEVMSVNLLLEDETAPVVWRGPGDCGDGQTVLDGRRLERCGLYVCGYAARHGRRAADCISEYSAGRHRDCKFTAGTRLHDRQKSRQYGGADEGKGAGAGRKYELCALPRLRQKAECIRKKSY